MKKRTMLALALALMMTLALTACGGQTADDWEYVKKNGELKIGYTVFAPMNYTDDSGVFVGFETEFAQAVCDKLGVKANFVEINWDNKVTDLNAKGIDCIWNGMTITDELKENIDISDPYIRNMQVIVIRAADAGKYKSPADLAGQTVEAEAGSAGADAVAADLPDSTLVTAAKQTDTLLEVKAGGAEAAVLDYVLACATVGEGTDYADLMIIPGVELSVEEYGVGFRKGSSLTAMVNQAMAELTADGALDALAEKYGLTEQLLSNQ